MTLTVSPTVQAVISKVGAYLVDATLGIVPTGTPVLRGPINRAAQPAVDHIIITPVHGRRLRTNVETDVDPFPAEGGAILLEQGRELTLQIDMYGDASGDWATQLSTVWRSEYAFKYLAPECAPLYADDGRQIPLVVGEEQYLDRWTIMAKLQFNPVTATPQEFASAASVELINVDERYPPS